MGRHKERERSLTNYRHGQKRLDLEKKNFIYCQSNGSRITRRKTKSWKHLPPIPPFFPGWTSLLNSLPPPPQQCRGTGNGGCGQFITHCLCCFFLLRGTTPRTLPLLQREVPPMGDTVLHKLLQHGSFPRAAVLHKLLQCGSLPQGAVLQEQAAPGWVPREVTSPASKPVPVWAPLSTCPQVLPEACSSMGSPRGHSLFQAYLCCGVGSSMGCRWISAPPWTSMGCAGTAWSSPGAAGESHLPLLLHWPWCLQSCFFHIFSLLYPLKVLTLPPLLTCVFTEALPLLLMGLVLVSVGSVLEPAGTGSVRHGGSF